MSREWAPGDVALVRRGSSDWHRAMWADRPNLEAPGWHCIHGPCDNVTDVRPLVVLDAEDREQVEDVFRLMLRTLPKIAPTHRDYADALQAALRSLIEPPKPPEPMGLGAVVEDGAGRQWVRTERDAGERVWEKPWLYNGLRKHWQIVDAVRILSEGVTA